MSLVIPLLILLLGEHLSGYEAIPEEIRKRLREAHTFNDLLSVTHVLLEDQSKSIMTERKGLLLAQSQRPTKNLEMKLQGAAMAPLSSSDFKKSVGVSSNGRINLEILKTIRQGNDTCELQRVCIPVPVDNFDPGLLVFPRCYEVTQCVGSCCESTESCHAISVQYLQQPIIELIYSGNNLFVINQTRNISFEEHTACSCRECSHFRTCPHKKVLGANCKCECENKEQERDCQQGSNKVWNEEKCTCACNCHNESIIDGETCLCHEQRTNADPDAFGNFRPDPSRLRTLRLNRRKIGLGATP